MNLNQAISAATEFNKINPIAVYVVKYKSGNYGWFDEYQSPYLQENIETGFRRFTSSQFQNSCVMILAFALLNLGNQITHGFQMPSDCNQLKSLLGIETIISTMKKTLQNNCNQLKSLLGIETIKIL